MSIAVMNWVWQHSPTSGNQRLVLLALADACSHDDGTGCWPSMGRIAAKANISTRTARRVVGELASAGHLVVHYGAGPNRTNTYTLILANGGYPQAVDNPRLRGGQNVPPDNLSPGHLCPGDPDTGDREGRTLLSANPPRTTNEPPPARAYPGTTPDVETSPGGGCDAKDAERWTDMERFVAELGPDWPLSSRQLDRLSPAIAAALADGWSPAALAAHVGSNTAGVRNPYAVLRVRLADLPQHPVATRSRAGPADRTLAEALTVGCPHGATHARLCALCRHEQKGHPTAPTSQPASPTPGPHSHQQTGALHDEPTQR